jgi:hypothetical protein
MISLLRIVEQQGMEGQYYDLGKDFALFRRSIDGSFEQIKTKFEQIIGSKLIGKRVRARASRGFKQYVKDYEFDVMKITLDDYYDNYVVVASDNTTPKPKEYFLKPGFKVTVIGPATGQPSPQKGGKPEKEEAPMSQPQQATAQQAPNNELPVKEYAINKTPESPESSKNDIYDAYPIDDIEMEVKPWISKLLTKPVAIRDFIPRIGWVKTHENGKKVAMFDLKIPASILNMKINPVVMNYILSNRSKNGTSYNLKGMEYDKKTDEWHIRIKKTIAGSNV